MHRPAAEWVAIIAAPVVIDVIRAEGEADGDTLSELLRMAVEWLGPAGKPLLAGGLAAFYWHIVRPIP